MRIAPIALCLTYCFSIGLASSALGADAGSRANVTGEPADTQTDSVVPELGGIVVLCNNQSNDQNACEPRDEGASDSEANIRFGDGIRGARPAGTSGGDVSEQRIPETLRQRDR